MEKVSKDKISTLILYASLLAFIVFTGYILHVNQEVLYTAHDRSEFLVGAPFFDAMRCGARWAFMSATSLPLMSVH